MERRGRWSAASGCRRRTARPLSPSVETASSTSPPVSDRQRALRGRQSGQGARRGQGRAHRRSRSDRGQHGAGWARSHKAVAACAHRPAGDEGRRRHLRLSMLERVIEERARGNPASAEAIRKEVTRLIGDDLSKLKPGSDQAMHLKQVLIEQNAWSQYLEVGIGPDAEIFTKAPPMSSVGTGMDAGLHPNSTWNNPEPELVLFVSTPRQDRRRRARQRRQSARLRGPFGAAAVARPRTTTPPARSARSCACSTTLHARRCARKPTQR